MTTPLHIGFIPLVDAAALIIAVDKGFAAAEGLNVTLVREVSWWTFSVSSSASWMPGWSLTRSTALRISGRVRKLVCSGSRSKGRAFWRARTPKSLPVSANRVGTYMRRLRTCVA